MSPPVIEANLIKTFRLFLVIELILLIAGVAAHENLELISDNSWEIFGVGVVSILLLAGYLSWPWLQKKLGRFYLPIALVVSVSLSLVLLEGFLYVRKSLAQETSEETAWVIFLILFIPLMLVSWQYDFKAVILYCIYTTALDAFLSQFVTHEPVLIDSAFSELLFIRILAFLIAGYIVSSIMKQFRQQRAQLWQANAKIAHYASTLEQLTISQERNRLARELHDTMAHTLSGMALQLEAVESLWTSNPDEAHGILGKALGTTRYGLTETRRALQALRALPLEDLGLTLALKQMAESAATRAGLHLIWSVPDILPRFSPDVEQGIYRVAQEAIENIVRHARAHQMQVGWEQQDGRAVLFISDDGCGFDLARVDGLHHFGLSGMSERASMLGAVLEIKSQSGKGTTMHLFLPIGEV